MVKSYLNLGKTKIVLLRRHKKFCFKLFTKVVTMLPSAPNKLVAVVVKIFMLIYLTTAT